MHAPRWWPRWLEYRNQDILGGGKVLESAVWLMKIGTFFPGLRSLQRERIPPRCQPGSPSLVLSGCGLVRTWRPLSAYGQMPSQQETQLQGAHEPVQCQGWEGVSPQLEQSSALTIFEEENKQKRKSTWQARCAFLELGAEQALRSGEDAHLETRFWPPAQLRVSLGVCKTQTCVHVHTHTELEKCPKQHLRGRRRGPGRRLCRGVLTTA